MGGGASCMHKVISDTCYDMFLPILSLLRHVSLEFVLHHKVLFL